MVGAAPGAVRLYGKLAGYRRGSPGGTPLPAAGSEKIPIDSFGHLTYSQCKYIELILKLQGIDKVLAKT